MQHPTKLAAKEMQLLFADLQPQIVQRSKTNDPKAIAQSAAVLAQLAKVFSMPVTISVVPEGGEAPELIHELAKETADTPQFLRASASVFSDEKTVMALADNQRKTLVIAGFATEVAVLHAVVGAIEAGYRVIVPVDACGGMSERTESAALRQIEAVGGEISATVTIGTSLEPDFTSDIGQKMFSAIQQLRLA